MVLNLLAGIVFLALPVQDSWVEEWLWGFARREDLYLTAIRRRFLRKVVQEPVTLRRSRRAFSLPQKTCGGACC